MNTEALPPRLKEMVELFQSIEDRSDRIDALISLAEKFREVPERIAVRPFPEDHRVPHCESEAYVFTEELEDGTLKLHFAVENPQGISAKATAAILDQTLSGETPEVVAKVPSSIVYDFFGHELSTGKGLGLTGMVSMVQNSARRHLHEKREGHG